jgi:hypothetical protein
MAFTDNCDLFAAVHEDGVNRVIRHFMRQRPSLFNYATSDIAHNRELWCSMIDFTPDVVKYNNPLFTIMPPLPVFGADAPPVGVGFVAQLVKAKIDFHPGNAIALPPQLNPPLHAQRFSLQFRVCAAIECPFRDIVDHLPVPPPSNQDTHREKVPPVFLPGTVKCFCLDVFVVGGFHRLVVGGKDSIMGKVDDIEIVDITPDELETSIECYLKTTVNVLLREKFTIAMEKLALSFPLFGLATITLTPTPNPPVPNNPAVEDDQLKVFLTMTVV